VRLTWHGNAQGFQVVGRKNGGRDGWIAVRLLLLNDLTNRDRSGDDPLMHDDRRQLTAAGEAAWICSAGGRE
jgi:hypothetical protein